MNISNSSGPPLKFSSAPHPPLSPIVFPIPIGDSLIIPAVQATVMKQYKMTPPILKRKNGCALSYKPIPK